MSVVDLNLLRVLDALVEERNVTRAGERLGLTQSAVSHALTRLRHHFDDPLFVRGPGGMAPTARALEVAPGIHAALSQLQIALLPSTFEPRGAERRFTIAASAFGCAILVPPLAARLAQRAPNVELVIVQPGADVAEQLDTRRADFVFWAEGPVPDRIVATPLLTDTLAWAVRAGHPVLEARVTLEALAALPHVMIAKRGHGAPARPGSVSEATWEALRPFHQALAAKGLVQHIGVTVPDIYSALAVVLRSDMATLAPRRLGQMSEKSGMMRMIDPPHPTPEVRLTMMSLRERLREPALAWMHDLLVETAAEV